MKRSLFPLPKQGSVFVIALWTLVVLSIVSLAITSLVWPQIKLAKAMEERFISLAAAEGTLKYVFFLRYKDPTPDYDSLSELGQELKLNFGMVKVTCSLTDEESKVNINTASKEIIMGLPALGDERLAKNIIDHRKQPFFIKEELRLIPGITEEMFNQCQDFITVWTAGKVNLNTASYQVLHALGLSQDLLSLVKRYRQGDDGIEGTYDDRQFKDITMVINDLRSLAGLSMQQIAQLQNILSRDLLTVKSNRFNLEVIVNLPHQHPRNFNIVFASDDNRVLQWDEP